MPFIKKCLICNQEFETKRKRKFLCLNKQCHNKHHSNKLKGHKPFNNIVGNKNPNWKGGIIIDKDGYRLIYNPEHPHSSIGYVREHRLVMEIKINRFLRSWEVVHHINGNRLDNRIENLCLMTKYQHDKEHSSSRKKNKFGRFI